MFWIKQKIDYTTLCKNLKTIQNFGLSMIKNIKNKELNIVKKTIPTLNSRYKILFDDFKKYSKRLWQTTKEYNKKRYISIKEYYAVKNMLDEIEKNILYLQQKELKEISELINDLKIKLFEEDMHKCLYLVNEIIYPLKKLKKIAEKLQTLQKRIEK